MLIAFWLEAWLTKDEILELYLNEIYYRNLAYGIEAASETYFGKTAKELTLGEAAFHAGLPQSPAVYDIYTSPEVTLTRQQQVLVWMFELSQAENCIEVSNSEERVCVDPVAATDAANQIKAYTFIAPSFGAKYPHWVNYVRAELERLYDAQTIYRSGFVVYTTLDPTLQDRAQVLVTDQVASMVDSNAKNGALVAIQPSTGEILAMVGSPDDAIGNRALRVAEGGRVLQTVSTGTIGTYACTLGGGDGRTLFLCVAPDFYEHNRQAAREAQVWITRVEVPGVGF